MKTLEQLRREKARLVARGQVRQDFKLRNVERKKLKRDIRGLKHPRTARVGGKLRTAGRGFGRLVQQQVRKQVKKRRLRI